MGGKMLAEVKMNIKNMSGADIDKELDSLEARSVELLIEKERRTTARLLDEEKKRARIAKETRPKPLDNIDVMAIIKATEEVMDKVEDCGWEDEEEYMTLDRYELEDFVAAVTRAVYGDIGTWPEQE